MVIEWQIEFGPDCLIPYADMMIRDFIEVLVTAIVLYQHPGTTVWWLELLGQTDQFRTSTQERRCGKGTARQVAGNTARPKRYGIGIVHAVCQVHLRPCRFTEQLPRNQVAAVQGLCNLNCHHDKIGIPILSVGCGV